MNYLVHLFVSRHDEDLQIGNWMGDIVRNKDLEQLPDKIVQGVLLHRDIDQFSDQHPLIKKGIQRIRNRHGKYAPVVLDIFYDFLLFSHWEIYGSSPFDAFTKQFYQSLLAKNHEFPASVQKRVDSMVTHQFLNAYTSKEGMNDVFRRVAERANFPNEMFQAMDHLLEMKSDFEVEFHNFFPTLQEFVLDRSEIYLNQRHT